MQQEKKKNLALEHQKQKQICNHILFMARRAIPMIAFPRVRCMFIYNNLYNYNYIYSTVHLREYALYT